MPNAISKEEYEEDRSSHRMGTKPVHQGFRQHTFTYHKVFYKSPQRKGNVLGT